MKLRVILCLMLFFCISIVFSQTTDVKKRIKLNETDIVYVMPGEKIFHMLNCEKLGIRRTGMPLSLALEKGYAPCPLCVPLKPEKPKQVTKETIIQPKDDIKKESKKIQRPSSIKQGFRTTSWGMNKVKVRELEGAKFVKEEKGSGAIKGLEMLIFSDSIANLDCFCVYYFAENKLVRGRYLISEEHSNRTQFVYDYENIKSQIEEKYGQPNKHEIRWLNDLYKDDPSEYGMAVAVGHLRYHTTWDLGETEIEMVLQGDNYKISFWIEYIGKGYKELETKVKEKAKKDIW